MFPWLSRWGAAADEAQLRQAADDMLVENDPQRMAAYLKIFEKRAFPLGFEPLLPYAWSDHERTARWSIAAISQCVHPQVRALGFQLIEAHHHISDALDIFIQNYHEGDDQYLAGLLVQTTDPDELHAIGFGLNDIFSTNPTVAAEPLLLELYERGPCGLCRERFVERLLAIDRLPVWMEQETCYDANPEIYRLITQYRQG